MGRQQTHTREAGEKQERAPGTPGCGGLHGDISLCMEVALNQYHQFRPGRETLSCCLGARRLGVPKTPLQYWGGMLGPKSPQLQQGSARCAGGTGGGRAASREGRRNAWERHPKGAPERAAFPANEVGACERVRAENPRRAHQAPCLR